MEKEMDWTTEVPRFLKLYMEKGKYGDGLISTEDEEKLEKLINDFGAHSMSAMQSPKELIQMAVDPAADAVNIKKVTELKQALFAALKLDDYPAPLYTYELFDVIENPPGSWSGRLRFFDRARNETTKESTIIIGRSTERSLQEDAKKLGDQLIRKWTEGKQSRSQ